MSTEEQSTQTSQFFENVEQKFREMISTLQTAETSKMTFSGLELLLEKEGRELLRLMLQSQVNFRGLGDVGSSVEGADEVIRTHKRVGERDLKSIFGKVELERMGYGNRGVDSFFPKDSSLNVPENSFSYELQRRISLEVIKGSFDNAVDSIIETTGQIIPKQQVEQISVKASQDFDAFYVENSSQSNSKENLNTAPLLILTTDGKGIVMHKEDLRPATRKKAEASNKKMETRLSPGEKKNSKRMATVASVYTINQYFRSPEDFKNDLDSIKTPEETPRPKPLDKRVWASVEKPSEEVITEMFDEAIRRDPDKKKTWVALVDGAPHQIKLIKSEAKSRGISITIICDIIHVVEYLWKAAWAFYDKEDNKNAEKWVNERFIAILEGKSSTVAAGIRRTATKRELSESARKSVDACSDYLLNKTPYLKYDTYLQQGFPIATGVIEGACRHLIKDRMDITGARWRMMGAEAILKLRSLKSSGDFSDYWKFHEKQEFLRNYESQYKNLPLIQHQILN